MFKTILVTLDGSEVAARALPVAGELASGLGAEVILLCVVGSEVERHFSDYAAAEHLETQEAIRAYLEGRARGLREAHDLEVRPEVVAGDGSASDAIVGFAEGVDLVVMSTRGRSGIARMVLGSVTQEVLRRAPVPVLVIRPWDEERRLRGDPRESMPAR